ncbi:MAG: FG-GAP-like repeat-containing protein [Candidatus Cloacimonetes bacterium]|nr:FG-GAP-like repeat-containing protein [Candidatus Cloacimonadota bacterium]
MKAVFILIVIFIGSLLAAQDFTQITTGDIVNDGGWNYSCCWADFNNDGWEDLFVCNNDSNNGRYNFLYWNNGDGTFTRDETGGTVTTDGGSSYGCCAADYDNDGFNDLFVANYNEDNFLYKNYGGGAFIRITEGSIANDNGRSTGSQWIDYDHDGWLDLWVCNRDEPNFLYHNNGDGTFERTYTGTLTSESRNTGNCIWADFDGNGYPDVFLANSGPNYNSLFFNNGDGTFTPLMDDPLVNDLESFDIASCGDIDNDGDYDIYTAPGMLPASAYDIYFYLNNGDGSFLRQTGLPHSGLNAGGGCSMTDWDNDGDLDVLQTAYDGFNLLLQNNDGSLEQITTGALAADGNYNKEPAWCDYDGDGDLDVFLAVNNYFSGNNKFFRNDATGNNWLQIKLIGSMSNYNGIGSTITITAEINGETVIQKSETDCRNSLITHFGLGDAQVIDELVIIWSSDIENIFHNVTVNQLLEIAEQQISQDHNELPISVHNLHNYPNPFNPLTNITYQLTSAGLVSIKIFNIKGQQITELANEPQPAGAHHLTWDATSFSSGIYYLSLQSGDSFITRKLILLK